MKHTTSNDNHRDYSNLAAGYDQSRFETPSGRFLHSADKAIVRELVDQAACRQILDVPTGTGRVFEYLRDFPGSIIGCDMTTEMLSIAQSKIDETRHSLKFGNASNLPFDDCEFDCLISLRFFHLFPTEDRICFSREFDRVVRPGGYVLCSFTNGWYGGGINWLRRALGFKTVHFLHFGELARLFPNWTIDAVRGNFLPCQWRIAATGRYSEKFLRWIASHTPMKYLCWERFYLLKKPEA